MAGFGFWSFVAGLGIFLYGMRSLESGIGELAGRRFKHLLAHSTNHPLKAIFSGTVATAILQSSSLVNLMLLAMVGSGVIGMHGAIGIVLGSNLGTTFTGWLVTAIGFKVEISHLTMPILGISCLSYMYFKQESRGAQWAKLGLGIGFLLLGLSHMKLAAASLTTLVDTERLQSLPQWAYFLIGMGITAIIQSSSAMMIVTLAALHSGAINLGGAAALIIGADLGTTSTVLLGSLYSSAAAKRVALAHFSFNLVTDLVAFFVLLPFVVAIFQYLDVSDPLVSLVLFHSGFNFVGIALFLPFLKPFSKWLDARFRLSENLHTAFIHNVPSSQSELALVAAQKELKRLLTQIHYYGQAAVERLQQRDRLGSDLKERYSSMKSLEGEILHYLMQIQEAPLREESAVAVGEFMAAVRLSARAGKDIKDILKNFDQFSKEESAFLSELSETIGTWIETIQSRIKEKTQNSEERSFDAEWLASIDKENQHFRNLVLTESDREGRQGHLGPERWITLVNVATEIYNSNGALAEATAKSYSKLTWNGAQA